ncbi:P-loop containing nucleoside triphosphate hydrolase protein [Powellomyces hirtus]|nr:P-loop containing nucleoside triphosphate hydrolase protein [Powellomyces hirtus]
MSPQSREYPGTFNFDRVFDWKSTQDHVFSYAASATIDDVMRGYNGTIFAYGQTGSGKTHTMMGDMENEGMKGLTPRIVESIFSTIFSSPPHLEFTVRVSFMEIYMEKIRDLLNPANDNLPIHEEKSRGVYVKGLLEVFVGSIGEVYDAMRRGQSSRMVAQTNMNSESSRSHSIFVLTITQKNLQDGSQKVGKLSLVDLAGSEKVGKTGASGQTLEEAKKINKSLSALGMVINALTDGKSSHIPYRDSKLTRILQESLGGNSRTTLIINCSPSSFNEAETVSTLRFGMRAKTIKNKAKINAELSPGELKALLKRCKVDLSSIQTYCHALEKELNVWRSGGTVSENDWVTPLNVAVAVEEVSTPSAPLPLPSSVTDSMRSSTPAILIADDEREDFLRRENELSDQLAEKEAELEQQKLRMEELIEAVANMRKGDTELLHENKVLSATVADLHLQIEKLQFETKDAAINLDSMKEEKGEMGQIVEDLKKRIIELQASQPVIAVTPEEKERRKKEKMAQMMVEFDPSASLSEKEKSMRASLAKLAHLKAHSSPPTKPEDIEAQHVELLEAKSQLEQQDALIEEFALKAKTSEEEVERLCRQKEELEGKVAAIEREYEELLDRTINEEVSGAGPEVASMFEDLKARLESVYESRSSHAETELEDYRAMLARKEEELVRMQTTVAEQRHLTEELKSAVESVRSAGGNGSGFSVDDNEEIQRLRKNMAQELAEFDGMKKKLMRDLKNRCEKVVELEISLEDVRDQYDTMAKTSNVAKASNAQQQKMAFLERNLEQLTAVQKTLVESNGMLKKDMVKMDRQLTARNERIVNLEGLLNDATTKLELQNQKFEAQLASMREKLQEARSSQTQNANPASAWLYSSRIAKPLRGGGNTFIPAGEMDSAGDVQVNLDDTPSKSRASWYISLLAKK